MSKYVECITFANVLILSKEWHIENIKQQKALRHIFFFLPLRQTICCSRWLLCHHKAITISHESRCPSANAASRQHLWLLLSATSNLIFSHGACSCATLLMVCIWGGFLGARLFARHSAPWPSSTPSLISFLFFPSVLSLSILLPILFWRRWNQVNDRKDHCCRHRTTSCNWPSQYLALHMNCTLPSSSPASILPLASKWPSPLLKATGKKKKKN